MPVGEYLNMQKHITRIYQQQAGCGEFTLFTRHVMYMYRTLISVSLLLYAKLVSVSPRKWIYPYTCV